MIDFCKEHSYNCITCPYGSKSDIYLYTECRVHGEILMTDSALLFLMMGKKIRRKAWNKGDYIQLNKQGYIVNKNGGICPIQFSRLYVDWEVVENDKL